MHSLLEDHDHQHPWEELHAAGSAHQLLGKWSHAQRYYEEAIALFPEYAPAQCALAQLQMMQSGFREGRELYESRFAARQVEGQMDWRKLPIARWCGEPLYGKHLHLWVEQGFGDVIMYAGFLPSLLAQRPARITLSMFPKMMSLFARSFPELQVESLQDIGNIALASGIVENFPQLLTLAQQSGMQIDLESMRQDYERALARGTPDYAAPMGDLMVYGLPEFVPAQRQGAFLHADARRMGELRTYLQTLGTGRLVGISWHTSNKETGNIRSAPLEEWLPILGIEGCHFISLQHHFAPEQIESFCTANGHRIIQTPVDILQDTEGLAALTACMDEVITIDNSTVHLGGALGVPTTLLLPRGCDFRWPLLQNAADTLWYKSVNTVRQPQPMDWQPVMAKIAEALRLRTMESHT